MAGRKIKLKDQLGRVINVPVATPPTASVTPPVAQPDTTRPAATVWKLIREIPGNIQKLAKLVGTGFTTRGADGEWHQRSIAQGEGIAVIDGDGIGGNPAIALAELPDAGGGSLQKTLRDDYGRLAGTSAATTTDLSEGANLYYTNTRADARAAAAVAAHVAEADPHPQYQMKLPAGTTGQFWRGNGEWSDNLQSDSFRLGSNANAPGLLPGITGQYIAGPDGGFPFGMYDAFGGSTGLIFRACGGTAAAPTALKGTSQIGQFQARGYDGSSYSANETVAIWFRADGDWTPASHPGRIEFFTTPVGGVAAISRLMIRPDGSITPGYLSDNQQAVGAASSRWSVFYAGTGTINTSDAREKTPVRPLSAAELAAAIELGGEIGAYQWLAMVEAKGDAARQHIGLTVQRAIAILESHGLDPFAYGFVCYDEWDELPEIRDEEGEIVQQRRPAGDRYSFRMDELLAFIARGMAHRLDAVEQRLAAAGL